MKTVKNYMGSNTYYKEVLDREEIEKTINEVNIDYRELVDSSTMKSGYKTFVSIDLETGELVYECFQNDQHNHPADDFEIVIGKIEWDEYDNLSDENRRDFLESYTRLDEELFSNESVKIYSDRKDLIDLRSKFISSYENVDDINELILNLLDDYNYYKIFSDYIDIKDDENQSLISHLRNLNGIEEVMGFISDIISEFEEENREEINDLFYDYLYDEWLIQSLESNGIQMYDEEIQEQLNFFYNNDIDME